MTQTYSSQKVRSPVSVSAGEGHCTKIFVGKLEYNPTSEIKVHSVFHKYDDGERYLEKQSIDLFEDDENVVYFDGVYFMVEFDRPAVRYRDLICRVVIHQVVFENQQVKGYLMIPTVLPDSFTQERPVHPNVKWV
jgi:hypothetical protein